MLLQVIIITDYKDTDIPPRIPDVLRSHQEKKNFLHWVPAFKQIRIWKKTTSRLIFSVKVSTELSQEIQRIFQEVKWAQIPLLGN